MRTPVAIGVALGGVLGLVLLALTQTPEDSSTHQNAETPGGSVGISVVPSAPMGPSLVRPSVGVGTEATPALGVGAAPVGVSSEPSDSVETRSIETDESQAQMPTDQPPTGAAEFRQWHVKTVLPQWKSLRTALRRTGRDQFREPILHLVSELELAQEGVSEAEYQALLASEQQLVNAIRTHHPGLWPIEEPLSFLEESLQQLGH